MNPLTSSELLILIPKLAKQKQVILSDHAQLRLSQPDRNMTHERLLFILKFPKLITSEWSDKYNEFSYKIEGFNNRHCVVVLQTDNTYIKVVTVF